MSARCAAQTVLTAKNRADKKPRLKAVKRGFFMGSARLHGFFEK